MAAVELVRALMAEGVEFVAADDRIRWRNSGGRVTDEVVKVISAEKAEVLKLLRLNAKPDDPPQPTPEAFPYGVGVTGNPRTWTGRVVSLDEWRRLSEWDRHGSTGKIWNGLTRQWEPKNGGTT